MNLTDKIDLYVIPNEHVPIVRTTDLVHTALNAMSEHGLGIACIVDEQQKLKGVFTDGDIRRHFLSPTKPFVALFSDDIIEHSTVNPKSLLLGNTIEDALKIFSGNQVWDVPVLDHDGTLVGLLHLHKLLEGLSEGLA